MTTEDTRPVIRSLSASETGPGRQLLRSLTDALWFPMFFFVGFIACYVIPLHSPSPHGVAVAVAGPGTAREIGPALARSDPGAFRVVAAATTTRAQALVRHDKVVAAYAVGASGAILYTASAQGPALAQVVTTTFSALAARQGTDLHTIDLVANARGDRAGTGLLYLGVIWSVVPYIAALMLAPRRHRRRTTLIAMAALGVVISTLGYAMARLIDLVPAMPVVMLYAFVLTQAVALVTYALAPLCRRVLPGIGLLLFVLLAIPSCGGAIPVQLVPQPFRALHPVMPLGNAIDAMRNILYFHAQQLLRPTLVLLLWVAAATALLAARHRTATHRHRLRAPALRREGAHP